MTPPTQSERDLRPDPSWNDLAARAGVEPSMLAPGEHPMNVELDAALYWPVGVEHPFQEARPEVQPVAVSGQIPVMWYFPLEHLRLRPGCSAFHSALPSPHGSAT